MESSEIAKQALTDENLLMMGMALAIIGFYAIAEWEILVGLFIVFSGYGIIITTTKIGKQTWQLLISRIKELIKVFTKT